MTISKLETKVNKIRDFHHESIANREEFWRREAERIHWDESFARVLDDSLQPCARLNVAGRTNL
ncbi:MAG: acetyl-coenzyme A synthetase N-terminal domain-containing protein [Bordetella sp.]|uniref:acetyl-coenzyme A synthetase N-terminal domain-containing protein n=1 Tax=Bordetella sp. TaxID=28081 RepID=UPI003F7CB299